MKRSVSAIAISLMLGGASVAFGQNSVESLFKAKCAACHGPDGGGKTLMGEKLKARDLRLPDIQKQSDVELTQIITKGKEKMPAYDGKLTKEPISQVVGFIRELAKKH